MRSTVIPFEHGVQGVEFERAFAVAIEQGEQPFVRARVGAGCRDNLGEQAEQQRREGCVQTKTCLDHGKGLQLEVGIQEKTNGMRSRNYNPAESSLSILLRYFVICFSSVDSSSALFMLATARSRLPSR